MKAVDSTAFFFLGAIVAKNRESSRTNGSEEVSRRETKRVFRARAGRRSTNSRGSEVERRDGRAKRNARTTAYRRDRRESPFEGDRRARSALGGLEGHVTEGHKKGADQAGPSQGG